MEDLDQKILGNSKFICGDNVTIYDFCIAGFFTDRVLNPNNERTNGDAWKAGWNNAPQRVKEYVKAFQEEMADYLKERAEKHSECTM